ncbi:MAG: tetratricopeptide repeat protein [bacterium]
MTQLLLLLVLVGDGLAAYGLAALSGWLKLVALAGHVVMVCLAIKLCKRLHLYDFQADENFVTIAFFLALVLPGYGLAGLNLVIVAMNRVRLQPTPYFEIEEALVSDSTKIRLGSARPDVSEIQLDALDLQAFRDVLKSNDRQLEENAINKLSKLVTRESVAILRQVVREATSDTRLLAATALIELENKIVQKIDWLRGRLADRASDSDSRLQLARMYDLYCYLGVLDEESQRYYNKLAVKEYRSFLIANPKHPQAVFEYGRSLLAAGDIEKAKRVLSTAVGLAGGNPSPHLWLAEAHYEAGEYGEAAAVCRRVHSFANLPENLRPVTSWWCEETSEPG